jgi:branched-chain amino acid transport system permease protein
MDFIKQLDLRKTLMQALIAGIIALSVSAIGMVDLFGERYLIAGLVTVSEVLFLGPAALFGYAAAQATEKPKWLGLVKALLIGLGAGLLMLAFVWLAQNFDVRSVFINVSPHLISLLTFEKETGGTTTLFLAYLVVALAGGLIGLLPKTLRSALLFGAGITFGVGLLSEILSERIRSLVSSDASGLVFASKALLPWPALILFVVAAGFSYLRTTQRIPTFKSQGKQRTPVRVLRTALISALLLYLPMLLGSYLTEVTNNIGLFFLMGLGLNIVVGLAGLLDLGYVAFFAIGAYTMAVLTSTGDLGLAGMSFWAALPICVAVAGVAGFVLGVPVLRMRGDYLAIVTLGFGEIIRILALSDLLKPYIGGAQGILNIPKPQVGDLALIKPEHLYYVVLAGVLIAVFISLRVRESQIGRRWMALREDEDVAEAMGINLVSTKLLAFSIGAAFSGLAGAIFAAKLSSIFPHSFNLLISINVLSLIIVGGLGSIPGTLVGAIILVGLPELLREFAEFRWLAYGVLLVMMMLNRPEGFIPSETIKRELHSEEPEPVA